MTLQRALELCNSPLEQSRSHLVKLDRYALKHVLKDREDKLTAAAKETGELTSKLREANAEIEQLKAQLKPQPQIPVIP